MIKIKVYRSATGCRYIMISGKRFYLAQKTKITELMRKLLKRRAKLRARRRKSKRRKSTQVLNSTLGAIPHSSDSMVSTIHKFEQQQALTQKKLDDLRHLRDITSTVKITDVSDPPAVARRAVPALLPSRIPFLRNEPNRVPGRRNEPNRNPAIHHDPTTKLTNKQLAASYKH